MRMLEPGDKIDKTHDGQIIYTMIVTHVTEDRAFADIPGGSDPYVFLRECDSVVRNVYPGSEGYVVHNNSFHNSTHVVARHEAFSRNAYEVLIRIT